MTVIWCHRKLQPPLNNTWIFFFCNLRDSSIWCLYIKLSDIEEEERGVLVRIGDFGLGFNSQLEKCWIGLYRLRHSLWCILELSKWTMEELCLLELRIQEPKVVGYVYKIAHTIPVLSHVVRFMKSRLFTSDYPKPSWSKYGIPW